MRKETRDLIRKACEMVIGDDEYIRKIPTGMYIKAGDDDPVDFGKSILRKEQRMRLERILATIGL